MIELIHMHFNYMKLFISVHNKLFVVIPILLIRFGYLKSQDSDGTPLDPITGS